MKRSPLPTVLSRALRAVQTTSLLAASACGGNSTTVDLSLFEPPSCVRWDHPALDGLHPAVAVDYLELRDISDPIRGIPTFTLSQSGTRCKGAPDQAACETALASVMSSSRTGLWGYCMFGCTARVLLTTQAENIGVIDSKAKLDAFLAPYDTAQEAVLAAMASGSLASCTDPRIGGVRAVEGGYEVLVPDDERCGGPGLFQVVLRVDSSGNITELVRNKVEEGRPGCVVGRRPAGLLPAEPRSAQPAGSAPESVVGAYFANQARLESAAVTAFRVLRRELASHGAPRRLLRRVSESARDEVRHVRTAQRLARRYRATSLRPVVRPQPPRALLAIAVENMVEGCVRETYGALVGMWQAGHAQEREVACALARITRDEVRHAELSHQVARWLWPRLTKQEQAVVSQARTVAIAELRSSLRVAPEADLVTQVGLPTPAMALQLIAQLEQRLWHR